MKKIIKKLSVLILSIALLVAMCGCTVSFGDNAYEIAVKNGFSGTEKEWLESLKGEAGAAGADGIDGKDGENFNADFTASQLYDELCAKGYTKTFEEFIKEYFTGDTVLTDNRDALNKGIYSSCNILCPYTDPATEKSYVSGGSGVFYKFNKTTGNAIVITNFHVVYNTKLDTETKINDKIYAYIYGDKYFNNAIPATFVGGSAEYDIAVLQISASDVLKNSDCIVGTFADSAQITAGDKCIAIGNPQSDGTSVTEGIISVDTEQVLLDDVLGKEVNMRLIRIDAPVNPGNSGGGLFNDKGEIIGIVNAKLIKENCENVGYAIPSNVATAVAENILTNCLGKTNKQVIKPLLGIMTKTQNGKAIYNSETKRIEIEEEIVVSSITETCVVKDLFVEGDILKTVNYNGKLYQLNRNFILVDLLINAKVGDTFSFSVLRENKTVNFNVTIAEEFMKKVD